MKWVVEIIEINIIFVPTKAIKTQAIANFVAELAPWENGEEYDATWTIFVDGLANKWSFTTMLGWSARTSPRMTSSS